jgi:hypothetical protein
MTNRRNTLYLLASMLAVGQAVSIGVDGKANLPLLVMVLVAMAITATEKESRPR